jgi:16S rRNA (cytosine967-C5)-methyltransferase
MVNAVLRRAAKTTPVLPARQSDELHYLSIAYSHPRWLVERLGQWFGTAGAEGLMACNNAAAPNVARLNLAKGTPAELLARLEAEGIRVACRGILEETVILQDGSALSSPARNAGLFHLQAEASQMVARILAPPLGATVLDSAAAPGGKATHLSELVGPRGRVVALDVSFNGLLRVRDLARRLGHGNVFVARADASRALPLRPQRFRHVLLDAPCTGLGTLREHPEIRWRLSPDDPARLGALQAAMLDQVAEVVAPGGVLVYAVCSFAPEETTGVLHRFLESHRQFVLDAHPPIADLFPADFRADGTMLTRPDRGGRDGFFAARLIRARS